VSRRTERRDRLWALYAILLWIIALGWTLVGKLFNELPPFSVTANDKLRFVALFIAAVIAARMLDRLSYWYLLFGGTIAAAAMYVYVQRTAMQRPSDLVAPATVILLAAVLLFARRYAPAAAFVLLTVDLFVLNAGFNALVESRYYRPRLPIVEELRRVAPAEPYRIAGLEWMFLPNASAQYGLEDIRGSDPMAYARYTELLKPIVADDPSIDFDRVVNVHHPLLDALNVRFLLTEPGVEPGGRWKGLYRGPDGSLFENPSALPRFYVREGDGDVAIRQEAPGRFRLVIRARTPVRIGSSQINGPGWRVKGAEQQAGAFIEFRLPVGEKTVEVAYQPLTFWVALAAGIALCLVPLSVVPTRERSLKNQP
jgi:hypothetical protein